MGSIENKSISDMRENILCIFKDFMTGITKIDELGTAGSRLLIGFQQALEYLRRPPIEGTSELIDNIIKANETQRVKMYIEAGCRNSLHGVQNVNKTDNNNFHYGKYVHMEVNSCKLGLLDHNSKAKVIVEELEGLLDDVTNSLQRTDGNLLLISEKDSDDHPIHKDTEGLALSDSQNFDVTQLAALMSIIYSMVKQDYLMQEKIVSALNLKSSSGELESYCLLWSLRPFINDDIIHQAWRLIP
ncbi:uncharacterized protein LOC114757996 isoform X1 [Neltuma alba]|uniref:uncharacterized protein LOC114757996 isoform X1 n=1 Tax=Neltuma alba TaxID=207710 RepID=UPI0010A44C9C|nr:uncharacterized protein LOC114757996 isoform X1 [Prosopis alba]XP_028802813.1 uncharacterized protein LOC114757996 isoform X1 [Prosopis alba]